MAHDSTPHGRKWPPAGNVVLQLALLGTFLVIAAPFMPTVPPSGFDSCWGTGMDYALDHGFVFGRDLIYTYGPYNDVCTGIFNPARPWRGLLLGLALGTAAWAGLFALTRPRRRGWLLAFLVALAASGPAALASLLIPLLFTLLAGKALFAESDAIDLLAGIGLSLSLGLLCLMKLSNIFWCAFAVAFVTAAFLLRRKWSWAAGAAALPMATLLALRALAGQPWAALPDYFAGAWRISYGYNQAMHSLGDVKETILLLLAGGSSLYWLFKHAELTTRHRLFLLLGCAAFWFFAIKTSIVRHDAHAIFGGSFALLFPLLLGACYAGRRPILPLALCLLACAAVDFHYGHSIPGDIAQTYARAGRGIGLRLRGETTLLQRREEALRKIAAADPLPYVPGRVDLYPSDISQVVAKGMCWSPRPVFQSHEVSSPALAELNRRHLLGAKAPDTIFFNVQAIDRRYPNLEDGASWPVLLARYAPSGFAGDYAILRRRTIAGTPPDCGTTPLGAVTGRLDAPIVVPQSDAPVFVRMDMRPTLLGSLANLLYKFNRLKFKVDLADGSRREYRIIPIMARAGFVLSPLVENGRAFASLYAGRPSPKAPRVVRMTVVTGAGFAWQWEQTFQVRFSAVAVPPLQHE